MRVARLLACARFESVSPVFGPIAASEIGVKTLDVGMPQFAMHSVRETAGAKDAYYLFQVLKEFYANDFDMD